MTRRKIIVLALVALAVISGLIAQGFRADYSSMYTNPDGTVFILEQASVGPFRPYLHGTMLSRTIGRFVPPGGLHFFGLRIERPEVSVAAPLSGSNGLSLQIRVFPKPSEQASLMQRFPAGSAIFPYYRLAICGDDGFPFYSAATQGYNFYSYPDGRFAEFWASLFPRDSKWLRFRFEKWVEPAGPYLPVAADFTIPNPKPAKTKPWRAQSPGRQKLAEGLEAELSGLVLPSNFEPPYQEG